MPTRIAEFLEKKGPPSGIATSTTPEVFNDCVADLAMGLVIAQRGNRRPPIASCAPYSA